jgi:hypothetical protein
LHFDLGDLLHLFARQLADLILVGCVRSLLYSRLPFDHERVSLIFLYYAV